MGRRILSGRCKAQLRSEKRRVIVEDMRRAFNGKAGFCVMLRGVLVDTGFRAVIYYRIARWLLKKNIPYLPALVTSHAISKTGAEIRPSAEIGPGLVIKHSVGVVIGGGVILGKCCTILQNVTLGEKYSQDVDHGHDYPVVGDNVTFGAGAVVIGALRIGHHAFVGANAVVLKDVPHNAIVAGNPARIVGNRQIIIDAGTRKIKGDVQSNP